MSKIQKADANILITMAGRGQRFIEAGFELPKPMIQVRGREMILWAMDTFKEYSPTSYIFCVLKEQIELYSLDNFLIEAFGTNTKIVVIDELTEGQACTALLAKEYIDNEDELIIYNCDTYCQCDLKQSRKDYPACKGFVPTFKAQGAKWSFVKVDSDGIAVELAEKKPISDNATVGLYHFTRGADFVWAAEQMIAKNIRVNNEFYIAPAYNELIERGDEIRIVDVSSFWCFGTPEQLTDFEQNY